MRACSSHVLVWLLVNLGQRMRCWYSRTSSARHSWVVRALGTEGLRLLCGEPCRSSTSLWCADPGGCSLMKMQVVVAARQTVVVLGLGADRWLCGVHGQLRGREQRSTKTLRVGAGAAARR